MRTDLTGAAYLIVLAAVGVGAFVAYRNWDTIKKSFDPTSSDNLASKGSDKIVKTLTGGAAQGGEDSLGGVAARFREWLTGTNAAIERMKASAPAPSVSTSTADSYLQQLDDASPYTYAGSL